MPSHHPSMGVFASSGKVSNPLANMGVIVGLVGAALSVILWIHHYQPDIQIVGHYTDQLNGDLGDQARTLAAVLGAMAVISAIAASLGAGSEQRSGHTAAALILGVVALSYPVLTALNVVTRYVPNPVGGSG
jgi:hypothetical protein